MMLALALVALITALALPRVLPNSGATAVRTKAFEIAALLRGDRNAALRTGRMIATVVDARAGRVRSGASGAMVVVPDAFVVRLAASVPGGFHFFPDGRSSGGDLSVFTSDMGVQVRVNDLTAAISIRPANAGRGG